MNPFDHAIWQLERPADFTICGLGDAGVVMLSSTNRLQAYEMATGALRWDVPGSLLFGSSERGCVGKAPGGDRLIVIDATTGRSQPLDVKPSAVELPDYGWDNQGRLLFENEIYLIRKEKEDRRLTRLDMTSGKVDPSGPLVPAPLTVRAGPDELWLQWRDRVDGRRVTVVGAWDGSTMTRLSFPFLAGALTVTPDWVGFFGAASGRLELRVCRRSSVLAGDPHPVIVLTSPCTHFAAWRDHILYVPEEHVVACVRAGDRSEQWRLNVIDRNPRLFVCRNTAFLGSDDVVDLTTGRSRRISVYGHGTPVIHAEHVFLRDGDRFACIPIDVFGASP